MNSEQPMKEGKKELILRPVTTSPIRIPVSKKSPPPLPPSKKEISSQLLIEKVKATIALIPPEEEDTIIQLAPSSVPQSPSSISSSGSSYSLSSISSGGSGMKLKVINEDTTSKKKKMILIPEEWTIREQERQQQESIDKESSLPEIVPDLSRDRYLSVRELLYRCTCVSQDKCHTMIAEIILTGIIRDYQFFFAEGTTRGSTKERFYLWDRQRLLWRKEGLQTMSKGIFDALVKLLNLVVEDTKVSAGEAGEAGDEESDKTLRRVARNFITLRDALGGDTYRKSIIAALRSHMANDSDQSFEESLDNPSKPILPLRGGYKISMTTGEISKRTCNDRFTFELNCDPYDDDTPTRESEELLMKVMCEYDPKNKKAPMGERSRYLARALGCYISGDLSDKTFMIWTGDTNNGKTHLVNILAKLMGKYHVKAADEIFFSTRHQHDSAKVALKGRRLVTKDEAPFGSMLNVKLLKELTGDCLDNNLRKLYEEQDSYTFCCHFILDTNAVPRYISDQALMTRIRAIKFNAKFQSNLDKEEIGLYRGVKNYYHRYDDPRLMAGFLKLLVNGYLDHIEDPTDDHLKLPPSMKDELDKINAESNPAADFIEECCVVNPDYTNTKVKESILFTTYQQYCIQTRRQSMQKNMFREAIKSIPEVRYVRDNVYWFKGIGLTNQSTN